MFNIPFLILWIIIIFLLVFLGYQGFRNVSELNESKNTYVLDTTDITCYPNGSVENLPKVQNTCCKINGVITTKRPFNISSYNLPVIVDSVPIPFSDACYGFCSNIDPITGVCQDTFNISMPYSRCIQATIPVSQEINGTTITSNTQGCITSSLPVARVGLTPYYIQSPLYYATGIEPLTVCEIVSC
jgi:hypothetical protein